MSSIPSALAASLLQTSQAQQVASKARDADRNRNERAQRLSDLVELRAAAVESADALPQVSDDDPQTSTDRQDADSDRDGPAGPAIDLRA